jgi:hypothetical protein
MRFRDYSRNMSKAATGFNKPHARRFADVTLNYLFQNWDDYSMIAANVANPQRSVIKYTFSHVPDVENGK